MSGRALFPLSINVAALLSRHFDGKLPISYSGGASKFNIRDIFESGIRPNHHGD
ncbi:putative selenate reductase subunit YgfK [Morganella morganii]|nr:putative selenate reductase subunit YgfK [Morganella morganii]